MFQRWKWHIQNLLVTVNRFFNAVIFIPGRFFGRVIQDTTSTRDVSWSALLGMLSLRLCFLNHGSFHVQQLGNRK